MGQDDTLTPQQRRKLGVGKPCPRCRSWSVWFELGEGEHPGTESRRIHCDACGLVYKWEEREKDDGNYVPPSSVIPC